MPDIDAHEPEPTDDTDDTKNGKIVSQPAYKSTVAKLRRFLDAYAGTGFVNQSCDIAGLARKTHYRKLQTDPAYKRAFEEAQNQVGQLLEDEIVRLALAGDSHLLLAAVRRFRPEWREKLSAEISGTINLADRMTTALEHVRVMRRNEAAERAG